MTLTDAERTQLRERAQSVLGTLPSHWSQEERRILFHLAATPEAVLTLLRERDVLYEWIVDRLVLDGRSREDARRFARALMVPDHWDPRWAPPTHQSLSQCPRCGGPADAGHDREDPPNPYACSRCDPDPREPESQRCEKNTPVTDGEEG